MEPKTQTRENPQVSTINDGQRSGGFELLANLLRVREESNEVMSRLEAAVEKVGKVAAIDSHTPAAMAEKAETIGTNKGNLNTISTVLLGILAGVFIGLGAMFMTIVTTSTGLGFGLTKLIGGLVFCLGLILVVVAGAELFTGNTLIVMSWMSGKTTFNRLMRNWSLVYFANLAGALSLVGLMFYTNQWSLSGNAVGANALAIANAKVNLDFGAALTRGILCNALVCLAVWLCYSARTVADKIIAIIFPITAFVAAGFEHSIANMYFIPMGILLANQPAVLSAANLTAANVSNLTWAGFVGNLVPVTIGNIIGGSVLIGMVYWLSYLRSDRAAEVAASRPWLKAIIPSLNRVAEEKPAPAAPRVTVERPVFIPLPEPIRIQIDDLIRSKEKEPALLDRGGKAVLDVLAKLRDDSAFMAKLAENHYEVLRDYSLTPEETAALISGDIRWIESKMGTITDPLRTWLTARLAQEKW